MSRPLPKDLLGRLLPSHIDDIPQRGDQLDPKNPEGVIVKETITFTLNGEAVRLETEADRKLLWALRTDLEKTGTKYGCGEGFCGSCTVLVDGAPVRACLATLDFVQGKTVTTVEGLAADGELHPLQREFFERGGYQCGYCTPGMIMNAYGMLRENPNPTREEIIQGMENNLCRCSAYKRIVEAIEAYAGANGGDHV
jgi:aerobic-type carbon monoxide dehydrogenase small subunit (CoxS/CutS family)